MADYDALKRRRERAKNTARLMGEGKNEGFDYDTLKSNRSRIKTAYEVGDSDVEGLLARTRATISAGRGALSSRDSATFASRSGETRRNVADEIMAWQDAVAYLNSGKSSATKSQLSEAEEMRNALRQTGAQLDRRGRELEEQEAAQRENRALRIEAQEYYDMLRGVPEAGELMAMQWRGDEAGLAQAEAAARSESMRRALEEMEAQNPLYRDIDGRIAANESAVTGEITHPDAARNIAQAATGQAAQRIQRQLEMEWQEYWDRLRGVPETGELMAMQWRGDEAGLAQAEAAARSEGMRRALEEMGTQIPIYRDTEGRVAFQDGALAENAVRADAGAAVADAHRRAAAQEYQAYMAELEAQQAEQERLMAVDLNALEEDITQIQKEMEELRRMAALSAQPEEDERTPQEKTRARRSRRFSRDEQENDGRETTPEEKIDAVLQRGELAAQLEEMENLYQRAKLAQTPYEEDFAEFSQYDPTLNGLDVEALRYRQINEPEWGENYAKFAGVRGERDAEKYSLLTESEKAIYNYLYKKEGSEAAGKYLESLEDALNMRIGMKWADEDDGLANYAAQIGRAFAAGAERNVQGLKNLFVSDGELTANQYATAFTRENAGPMRGIILDLAENTGNQVAGMALRGIAGPIGRVAGLLNIAASAAGNARQQALEEGYTNDQATLYGILRGAAEMATSSILGGMGNLAGAVTGKTMESLIGNINRASLRAAARLGTRFSGEFVEEELQSQFVEKLLRNMILGEDNQIKLVDEDALYEGLVGGLSALLVSAPGITAQDRIAETEGRAALESFGADTLRRVGMMFPEGTEARRLAARNQGEMDERYAGRLYRAIQESERGQSMLTAAFSNAMTGQNVTEEQAQAIQASEQGREIFRGMTGMESERMTAREIADELSGKTMRYDEGAETGTETGTQRAELRTPLAAREDGSETPLHIVALQSDGGRTLAEMSDGSLAQLSELNFATEEMDVIAAGAQNFGAEGAAAYLAGYEGGDVAQYDAQFRAVYRAGQEGESLENAREALGIQEGEADAMSRPAMEAAWQAGRASANAETSDAMRGEEGNPAETDTRAGETPEGQGMEPAYDALATPAQRTETQGEDSAEQRIILADAFSAMMNGGEMTAAQAQAIRASEQGREIFRELTGLDAGALTDTEIEAVALGYARGEIRNTGEADARAETRTQKAARTETEEPSASTRENAQEAKTDRGAESGRETGGVVRRFSQGERSLSRRRRAQLRVLDKLGQTLGRDIEVVDSIRLRDGREANGYFDEKTGRIVISLEAIGDAYTAVAFHELVHALRQESEGDYQALREFVFRALEGKREYAEAGGAEARARELAERNGWTEAHAEEEMLADAMTALCTDEAVLRDLASENGTLLEKIERFLERVLEVIRTGWAEYASERRSLEATMLAEDTETLRTAYQMMRRALEERRGERISGVNPSGKKFSLKNIPAISTEAEAEADERRKAADDAARRAAGRLRGVHLSEESLQSVARSVLREKKSGFDEGELTEALRQAARYMERGGKNWRSLADGLTGLARSVLEKSVDMDTTLWEQYADMRAYFRNTPFSANAQQRAEAEQRTGDYGAFRRKNFGRMRIRADERGLDSLWPELTEKWPEFFPRDASPAEQLMIVSDALDAVRKTPINPYGMDMEGAAYDLALEMIAKLSGANEAKAQAESVKKALDRAIRETRAQERRRYEARLAEERRRIAQTIWAEADAQRIKERTETIAQARAIINRSLERQQDAKIRQRIEKLAHGMLRWMEKPTDKKHVPDKMERSLAEFLSLLEFGAGREAGSETRKNIGWQARMRTVMARLADTDEGMRIAQLLDVETMEKMQYLTYLADDRPLDIREMTGEPLKMMLDVLSAMNNAIRMENESFALESGAKISEIADRAIQEWRGRRQASRGKIARDVSKMMKFNMMDAFTFKEEIGKAGGEIIEALRRGYDDKIVKILSARDFMAQLRNKNKIREWAKNERTYKTEQGREMKISDVQIMELYCLSRREQAMGHLLGGGVNVENLSGTGRRKGNARYLLTTRDIASLTGMLSKEQKALCEAMQRYLSTTVADWGNRTSMRVYGYKKFTEKFYWPIRTDRNFISTIVEGKDQRLNRLEKMSATRQTVEGANNPIYLGDAFTTFSDHVAQMADWSAMMPAMQDALRFINYRSATTIVGDSDDAYSETTAYEGVKESLENSLGRGALEWMTAFLDTLNGVRRGEGEQIGAVAAIARNARTAAVAANLRVVLQQPTAYLRAFDMIDMKWLAAGAAKNPIRGIQMAQKYSPIAAWKTSGFYDVGLGASLRQIITGDATAQERMREAGLMLASKADEMTWGAIWNACEAEISQKWKLEGRETKTTEFYRAVGRRFSDVIDATQVVDSPFHRTHLMRSASGLTRETTAFMSEPSKSYNMLYRSIARMVRERGENKKTIWKNAMRVARSLTAYAGSTAAAGAMAAIQDAFRNANEREDWLERYMAAAWGNMLEMLNPLGMIPFWGDIINTASNIMLGKTVYNQNAMAFDVINDTMSAARAWRSYAEGESTKSLYALTRQTIYALSSLTGIPVRGIMRETEAFINTFWPGKLRETKLGSYASIYGYLAYGNTEGAQRAIDALIEEKTKMGKTEDEAAEDIISQLKTKYRDTYKSMYQAGDTEGARELQATLQALHAGSITMGDEVFEDWQTQDEIKAEKEALYSALESGRDVNEAMQAVRARRMEAGETEEEANKALKSMIGNRVRDEYKAAFAAGDETTINRLRNMLLNLELGESSYTREWLERYWER